MNQVDEPLLTLDEDARRRFEAAWKETGRATIEQFLPPEDDARFLPTLEELVHIDIEFAWKARRKRQELEGAAGDAPERIEDYLSRFPRLNQPPMVLRLIQQEYAVRQRCGEGGSHHEYCRRFPDIPAEQLPGRMQINSTLTPDEEPAARTLGAGRAESKMRLDGEVQLPRPFGNYVLLEELGRGGMGIVYRARQATADRLVALKVVRADFLRATESESENTAVERFRHEIQAAARLDHDHIVTVYETGTVEGQPFFSMRYVDGCSLSQILRDGPVRNRQAAAYLQPVAAAVEHAHQLGILHRDLKPQNILVDRETGRPFVADFGLAKLLRADEELTQAGEVMGSPPYMSPEQARDSARVTAHSDVYALGATLYHILTGRPPFQAASVVETIRQVIHDEPVPPCRLNPAIDKDLETICLKCLEKEPSRRYVSAAALADELSRYLRNEPILARPIGLFGKVLRWRRRNPLAASLLMSIAALLVLGLMGAVIGMVRLDAARLKAESGYRHARETVNRFLTRVSEETLLNEPGLQPLRRELLEDALDYYQGFLGEFGGDPELRDELAATHFRIGRINELIDSPDTALLAYQRALTVQQELLARSPGDPQLLRELGDTWNAIGGVRFQQRKLADAQAAHREAERVRGQWASLTPGQGEPRRGLANSLMNLGLVEQEQGEFQHARQHFDRAQALRQEAMKLDPNSIKTRRDLAIGHYNLAVLHLPDDNRDLAKAEAEFVLAIQRFDEVLQREPHDLQNRHRLALACRLLADVRCERGHSREAGPLYARALELMQLLAQRNPDVPDYQSALAQVQMNLGQLQSEQGDGTAALASLGRACEMFSVLVERHPERRSCRRDLAVVNRAMAALQYAAGRRDEAKQRAEHAQTLLRSLLDEYPHDTEYQALLQDTNELRNEICR